MMTKAASVWIVDDDRSIRWVMDKALSSEGVRVTLFESGDNMLQQLQREVPDVVVSDIRMPGINGLDLLERVNTEHPELPIIIMTAHSDLDSAVASYKGGAFEYLPKPFDIDEASALVMRAVEHSREQQQQRGEEPEAQTEIIGEAPAMQEVFRAIGRLSQSNITVLINGESGTGKEVLARYLHERSKRSDKQFVSVNCAAIPDNLLESELFGHEKGAFTGAVARRVGKFEEANGGTLLLDEISEMDIRLQAKLLRAVQEREIDRVGGSQPVKVDIRLLATSNRDLERHVREGNFREDLYFRLNVFNLQLPPLRQRPADIMLLANHFAKKYAEANGVAERPLSDEAIARLQGHHWRGNVRELENTLHRAVLLASGDEIGAEAIILTGEQTTPAAQEAPPLRATPAPQPAAPPARDTFQPASFDEPEAAPAAPPTAAAPAQESKAGGDLVGRTVADVEQQLIINTLSHCLGNRTHAANILGISIRTLRNKLKAYSEDGVSVPPPGEADRATV